MPSGDRGFLLLPQGDWSDLHRIEEAARDRGTFTEVLPSSLLAGLGHAICVLGLGYGGIDAIGLIKPGAGAATARRRATVSDIHWLSTPVELETLREALPSGMRRHMRYGPIPPATWRAVRTALAALDPNAGAALEVLSGRLDRSVVHLGERETLTLAEEKDSAGLALGLAGFPHRLITRWGPTSGTTSFLDGLTEVNIPEDQAIQIDSGVMPGWYRGLPDPRGIVSFWRDGTSLTVMNVNRTSVEHALGVDLLYHDEATDRFVLVQYKRLRPRKTKAGRPLPPAYRPDKNLDDELRRMREIDATETPANTAEEFRLHSGACYLKLCAPSVRAPFADELIKGMYLPLEYFDLLGGSPRIKGPKGGISYTYESVHRYLNNSDFIALFNGGWIGSRGATSTTLRSIVRSLVAADHSVTVASAETTTASGDDSRRLGSERY